MYEIIIYKDVHGKEPITEYIYELSQQSGKSARIKFSKIMEYIRQFETHGVSVGKPTVDHITGTDLWELRPTTDRKE